MFWFSEATMTTIVDSLNISKYDYIMFDYENSNQLPFGCTLEYLKYYEPTYYEFQGSACRNSIKINHHQSTGGDFEMKYKMYVKSFNDTTIILTGTEVLKPNQKPMVELLFN